MANPVGLLNGTKCLLKTVISGQQVIIGGATSNSQELSNALIDITNKSSGQKRTLLEGEGEQTLNHSMTCFYSDDSGYQILRDRADAKSIDEYIFDYGDRSQTMNFGVNFADTVEKNAAVSSDFTFTSSGDFSALLSEANFITSGGDNFITSDGDQFVVRG